MLFVHVLTALPQLLVVDNVDVRALLSVILHLSRVVLETSYDKLLVGVLIEAKAKQGNLFAIEEVFYKAIGSLPLLLIDSF